MQQIISVVIICKNQKSYLELTLPQLINQTTESQVEIIVVDSESTDGTAELVDAYGVQYISIPQARFSYPKAINLGFSQANGDVLIRLSGDVIPLNDDFLVSLCTPLLDSTIGASFGRYTISCADDVCFPGAWPEKRFALADKVYSINPSFLFYKCLFHWQRFVELRNLAGGCCALKAEIWQKRAFNEHIIEGEDAEYAVYLHHNNTAIAYVHDAVVLHEHAPRKASLAWLARTISIWFVLLAEFLKINLKHMKYTYLQEDSIW